MFLSIRDKNLRAARRHWQTEARLGRLYSYLYVCLCACGYAHHMWRCPRGPGEGVSYHGAVGHRHCKPHDSGAGNWTQLLCKSEQLPQPDLNPMSTPPTFLNIQPGWSRSTELSFGTENRIIHDVAAQEQASGQVGQSLHGRHKD